ncbi:MAG: hypothetical protein JNG85_03015 [Spirochaetaceae bacterium]|nr:hypothetical protein [Spirochaetaceae bacterium]
MSWSFETSLVAFLALAFAAQAVATLTKGRLSLPFVLGLACVLGFACGVLPRDLAVKSRMRDVGFIAFNVLVAHSGTMLDFRRLRREKGAVALSLAAAGLLALVFAFGLAPLLGREAALLAAGPVLGGGAASAIASNAAMKLAPGLAALPWLLFMFQGFFGLPLFAWALRREARRLAALDATGPAGATAAPGPAGATETAAGVPPCERLPRRYRSTAYDLGSLMLVAALNRALHATAFGAVGIHPALTALLFGALLARLGLLERDPLAKSDAMGLLMLGLMSLMADSFSRTPLPDLLALLPATLLALSAGTLVLAAAGIAAGRLAGRGGGRGLVLAANCLVGAPFSGLAARGILAAVAAGDEAKRARLEAELLPPIEAGANLMTNFVSIALAGLVGLAF